MLLWCVRMDVLLENRLNKIRTDYHSNIYSYIACTISTFPEGNGLLIVCDHIDYNAR